MNKEKRKVGSPEQGRRPGRPKGDVSERVQSLISKDTLVRLDQMVEYLGNGDSRSVYLRRVIEDHVKDMDVVLRAVRAGSLIAHYNKDKDRMMFIKREDYEKGINLGKLTVDM